MSSSNRFVSFCRPSQIELAYTISRRARAELLKPRMSVVNVSVKYLRKRGYNTIHEWVKDPNHVYIGRACHYVGMNKSEWANPFSVAKYGREKALLLYREHIEEKLLGRLSELEGKELGCWCHPERCHGDVLLEMLRERREEE